MASKDDNISVGGQWRCVFCTWDLNKSTNDTCQMCCKLRLRYVFSSKRKKQTDLHQALHLTTLLQPTSPRRITRSMARKRKSPSFESNTNESTIHKKYKQLHKQLVNELGPMEWKPNNNTNNSNNYKQNKRRRLNNNTNYIPMELIEENNKMKQLQKKYNELMKQKEELEIKMNIETKQLKYKIININKTNKNIKKSLNKLEKQNEELNGEQMENVNKIHNLTNIIENNKKKEIELINKCNSFQKKNENLIGHANMQQNKHMKQIQQKNNEIMQQKLELNDINKTNKNMEKSLDKLEKQNEELNGEINVFNGTSNRINVLSIEELNMLKLKLENGIRRIEQAKDKKIEDKTKCIICWENDKNVFIDSCKCFVLCNQCLIKDKERKKCPKCQTPFTTWTHIRLD